MLKRAANCLVIATIAAIFGFTGILQWTAVIAQSICLFCLGVALLSLLFSLFEEPSEVSAREIRLGAEPQAGSHHRL